MTDVSIMLCAILSGAVWLLLSISADSTDGGNVVLAFQPSVKRVFEVIYWLAY